jgi:hypothetical protein
MMNKRELHRYERALLAEKQRMLKQGRATDEVMDHPRSIIFDQSENRLHTEKGLLAYLVYPRLKRPTEESIAHHRSQILALLEETGSGG